MAAKLTVVGSINLDLVAKVDRLPRPGETLTGATLERIPGGKGANQAVAAARLGAQVRMVGCVGADANARDALTGLHDAGVELALREVEAPTGVAIILVAADGDAFTACLVVSLLEGRDREEALRRACAAGAIAASRFGAQPSLPTAHEVDAILRR